MISNGHKFFNINYNLDNSEEILKQKFYFDGFMSVKFEKKCFDFSKFKKPTATKENILKLKEKLESIFALWEIEVLKGSSQMKNTSFLGFRNFCIYKEILFLCENLKPDRLSFITCTFEEGKEKEILELLNNCKRLFVSVTLDKILFYAIKNCFRKVKDNNLCFLRVEYKSIKSIFFGMYLNILNLSRFETNEREMIKILKSLHSTVNLRSFAFDNNKAYGLIYNREKIIKPNNKKLRKLIYNFKQKFKSKKEEVVK